MYIGFSKQKTEALLQDIAEKYNSLENYVQSDFDVLINCLRNNWIGSDENNFETTLISRLHQLRLNSYDLCNIAINVISHTYEAWMDFQEINKVGETSVSAKNPGGGGYTPTGPTDTTYRTSLTVPVLNRDFQQLSVSENNYHDSEYFGLVSESSASVIKSAVESFVQNVKTKVSSLAETIKTNKAFVGEQSRALDKFIETLSVSLGDLLTSIKEMYDELDRLTVRGYKSQQEAQIEVFNINADLMSDQVDDLAGGSNNRWS